MYAELLVCHSRVISSYRSRQSRITRIIQPPHSIPIPIPIHIPIPYACLCFFARAHTYDLGVCVVATPALRWFSIFIRPASDVYPPLRPPLLPPPPALPTETLCSWLYRKRLAKHNMTTTRAGPGPEPGWDERWKMEEGAMGREWEGRQAQDGANANGLWRPQNNWIVDRRQVWPLQFHLGIPCGN